MISKINVKGRFRSISLSDIFKSTVLMLMFPNNELSSMFINAEQRFTTSTKEYCGKINELPNCKCEFRRFINLNEITCSKPDNQTNDELKLSNVIIRVPLNHNSLEIKCQNIYGPLHKLPDLNVGTTRLVQIFNCPLREMGTFSEIFQKFNLTNVEKLVYTSGDVNYNFSRRHLINLQNLTFLSLELKNSVALRDEFLFDNLNKLEVLVLRTYQLELPANLFISLRNLKVLELFLYNVTELRTDLFCFNYGISEISIVQSQIKQLLKGTFENLTSLSTLTISANEIRTLEPNIFDDLTNLSAITLNSNRIEKLPKGLFAYTKNLRTFYLAGNRVTLSFLPAHLLADLPVLKTVIISCHLELIPSNTFANSTMITTISLELNQLTIVPEALFFHQVNLIELDLSRNLLSELPEKLFINNKKLTQLKLSNNQIKQIPSEMFSSLQSLKKLTLDNNRLTTFDANTFVGLTRLSSLKLQNNLIRLKETAANSPFHPIQSLVDLDLCNNSITNTFFKKTFIQASLRKLHLCHNNISVIDLKKLQHISKEKLEINLANNPIQTIIFKESQNFSTEPEFEEIFVDLTANLLTCDCQLLEFVQFLLKDGPKNMHLKPNELACHGPEHLKNIHLRQLSPEELFCQLEICPLDCKCFELLINQTILVECVSGNHISMPDLSLFLKTDYSQYSFEINLENNNLEKLPKLSLANDVKITSLKLAGNKLHELDLQHLPRNLAFLDLRYNSFEILSSDILEYFEKSQMLKSLQLSGNPWLCNCSVQPLLEFAQRNFKKLIDISEMRCSVSSNNVDFHQLKISDLCSADRTLIICFSILTILILIFVIIVVVYMILNIEIKVWLYSHRMCLWFFTDAELDKDKIYDAFISYSSKDEQFVVEQLVPNLENGTPSFKVCVHYRNFLVGESIATNIANAVDNSRRTIILLSKNFIEADWTLHEFRSAHLAALHEKKSRIIVILFGDIGEMDAIDTELQAYLKTKTYLEWSDPKFWDRLRYAMPHSNGLLNDLTMRPIQNSYAIVNDTIHK